MTSTAAVLAERYEKVMCQGRRNGILREIAMLNGVDTSETCGHDVHKSKSRDSIGEDYGMTGRNIARYMRLNQTTDQNKLCLNSDFPEYGQAAASLHLFFAMVGGLAFLYTICILIRQLRAAQQENLHHSEEFARPSGK